MTETGVSGNVVYVYDAVGNLKTMEYPNGVWAQYKFDRLNRVTEVRNTRPGTGDERIVLSVFGYTYDQASRRTRIDIQGVKPEAEWILYGYDGLSRLTSEERHTASQTVYSKVWTYDLVGNRKKETHSFWDSSSGTPVPKTVTTEYTHDMGDRILSETKKDGSSVISVTTYAWDNNGNMTGKMVKDSAQADADTIEEWTYSWDYENHLTHVSRQTPDADDVLREDLKVDFTYCDGCALGKRKSKKVDRLITVVIDEETGATEEQWVTESNVEYIWDGQNIIGEKDVVSKDIIADYTVMPFSLMDNVVSMKKGNDTFYPLYDAMGTVWQVVSEDDGEVVVSETRDYDAWGVLLSSSSSLQPEASSLIPGWQTKPWDEEIGMYYSRARYYEPGTGRFVSVDPISPEATIYVHATPTIQTDPTGKMSSNGQGIDWAGVQPDAKRQAEWEKIAKWNPYHILDGVSDQVTTTWFPRIVGGLIFWGKMWVSDVSDPKKWACFVLHELVHKYGISRDFDRDGDTRGECECLVMETNCLIHLQASSSTVDVTMKRMQRVCCH